MFAADCENNSSRGEQAQDLLALASGQQNTNFKTLQDLLAVKVTEYCQFFELREVAESVAHGESTLICNLLLQNRFKKQVSTLAMIWHPLAPNSMQQKSPLWDLLTNQDYFFDI